MLVHDTIVEERCPRLHVTRQLADHSWVLQQKDVGVKHEHVRERRVVQRERLDPVTLEGIGGFLSQHFAADKFRTYIDDLHMRIDFCEQLPRSLG
jgi:hypothetical protein